MSCDVSYLRFWCVVRLKMGRIKSYLGPFSIWKPFCKVSIIFLLGWSQVICFRKLNPRKLSRKLFFFAVLFTSITFMWHPSSIRRPYDDNKGEPRITICDNYTAKVFFPPSGHSSLSQLVRSQIFNYVERKTFDVKDNFPPGREARLFFSRTM